jgi:hypothetical protein
MPVRWLTFLLSIFVLAILIMFPERAPGDVAFYMDIGGRVLDGQQPYIDFFETNPPVMHYLSTVPVWLSSVSNVDTILVANLLTFGLLLISMTLTHSIAAKAFSNRSVVPSLISFVLVIATLVIMPRAYGQREHLFMLMTLPFLLLRVHRWNGGTYVWWLAGVIGMIAAVGTSFKPWFVLLTLLLEGYNLFRHRGLRPLLQSEIAGILVVCVLYVVYGLANPNVIAAYFQDVVPAVANGYGGYTNKSLSEIMLMDPSMITFLALFVVAWLISVAKDTQSAGWLRSLTMAGVGSFLCYVLQFKGWYYHSVPLIYMVLLLLGFIVWALLTHPLFAAVVQRRWKVPLLRRIITGAMIALMMVWGVTVLMTVARTPYGEATESFRALLRAHSQPGARVLTADASIYPNYPAFQQLQLQHVGRYPFAYPVVFAYHMQPVLPLHQVYRADHIPPPLAQTYINAFVTDVQRFEPDLIIMQDMICLDCDYQINTARYMLARWEVAVLLERNYRLATARDGYVVYVRLE